MQEYGKSAAFFCKFTVPAISYMKRKLLLACALIIAGITGISAQSISLSNYNTTVSGNYNNAITSYVTITNNSSSDYLMMVERTIQNLVPGHMEYFCTSAFCYPPGTDFSLTPDTIQAGTNSIFYGDVYGNGNIGTSTIHYKFFNQADNSDSVGVTLNFSFSTVGLNDIKNTTSLSVPSPNPADQFTVFTYNLADKAANDQVVIYNMLGSLVKSVDVPGNNGVLVVNTADMRSGVYFVSYKQSNGKLSNTTKLVVSHR